MKATESQSMNIFYGLKNVDTKVFTISYKTGEISFSLVTPFS